MMNDEIRTQDAVRPELDLPVGYPNAARCCSLGRLITCGAATLGVLGLIVTAFLLGRQQPAPLVAPWPAALNATATHGGTDCAVATGQITDDAEGLFTLDFKTGDLSCFIYYPRFQRFGGKYMINVTEQLSATKNAEYLLVTGAANTPAITSNTRPSGTLVYVVDTRSGQFAAYGVGINPTAVAAGQPQAGPMVFLGGGEFRTPSAGSARRTLPGVDPQMAVPGVQPPAGQDVPAVPPNRNDRRRR